MAIKILGLVLWTLLGLLGAWWLVTGCKSYFDLPKGMKEGWALRLMGLGYVLAAGWLIYLGVRGSFSAEGLVLGYIFFLGGLAFAEYRRRKAARGSGPPLAGS